MEDWFYRKAKQNKKCCAFVFRTTPSQPRIQLCFSWLCCGALLAKFIVHQETGLHLLQTRVSTSSSTKYVKIFIFTRRLNLTQLLCVALCVHTSWAWILFQPLGSLQWPLFPPQSHPANVVQRAERMPQRGWGPGQHSQCGGSELCHLSTWIWYVKTKDKQWSKSFLIWFKVTK